MNNFTGDIGVISNGKAVVQFTNKSISTEPTKVLLYTKNKTKGIASWGSDNKLPQNILAQVRKNAAATSGLAVKIDVHYGSGFILFKETQEEKNGINKRVKKQVSLLDHKEIKTFFRANKMKKVFKECITDLEYFAISFPEYILSNDYNTITQVRRQKAAHCRFDLADEKDGYIKEVNLSSKWEENPSKESEFVKSIKLIDSYWTAEQVKEYCKANKIKNFVRPMFYTMLDESYYPIASWHCAYYSKWIEIANSIPEFKKALFENQVNIKYHIEVDEEYFKNKYKTADKNWEEFTVEEQQKERTDFVEFIDENLRGNANAGTSIWSLMYDGPDGKKTSGLKITAIDDKLKDGAFLPDGTAANSEVLSAFTVDGALIGNGIPGSLGAGSGSDKREAWLILSARSKTKRETTLEMFEFLQEYNKWDEDLIGAFEDTVLTTLDKNPTGTQKSANV